MIRLWDSKEILHTLSNYFALSTRDFAPQLIQNMEACEGAQFLFTSVSFFTSFCFSLPFSFFVCVVSFLFARFLFCLHFLFLFPWFLFCLRGSLFCLRVFLFVCSVSLVGHRTEELLCRQDFFIKFVVLV